ncbi:hypothetical protein GALMADRAFT_241650 [Galerina marginata CBS 339.88]|uniref:F-box domain-containing protein n=1 Tax=Galerina marginata (strain CBS 339.88) TaxID=685588 RepID=A0A067TPY7_GALM3|nr:hypothetical protein GALMADRAFT_241650 [Galerina marginata CBS 339.88]
MEKRERALPQELLDQVVDEIGREYADSFFQGYGDPISQKTLLSFLSVSRSFHDRAIAPLLTEVHLNDHPDVMQRITTLRQILNPTPGSTLRPVKSCIQKCVMTLSMHNQREPVLSHQLEEQPEEEYDKWVGDIFANAETSALFDDLHHKNYGIRELTIDLVTSRSVQWPDLPHRLSSSLLALIRSSHLESLHLIQITCLPLALLRGSSLKHLRLEQSDLLAVGGLSPVEEPDEDDQPYPKLESVQTDSRSIASLYVGAAASTFTELKQLRIDGILPGLYDSSLKILRLAQNTLEDISLHFGGELSFPAGTVDFGSMPRLRTFTLYNYRSYMDAYEQRSDSSMDHICLMLDARTPLRHLAELTLKLHFSDMNVREDFLYPVPNSHWQAIDAVLAGNKFPVLRKVNVQIESDVYVHDHRNTFDRQIFIDTMPVRLREALPRLSSSDTVELKVEASIDVLRTGSQ